MNNLSNKICITLKQRTKEGHYILERKEYCSFKDLCSDLFSTYITISVKDPFDRYESIPRVYPHPTTHELRYTQSLIALSFHYDEYHYNDKISKLPELNTFSNIDEKYLNYVYNKLSKLNINFCVYLTEYNQGYHCVPSTGFIIIPIEAITVNPSGLCSENAIQKIAETLILKIDESNPNFPVDLNDGRAAGKLKTFQYAEHVPLPLIDSESPGSNDCQILCRFDGQNQNERRVNFK